MHTRIFAAVILLCIVPLSCKKKPDSKELISRTSDLSNKPSEKVAQMLEALRKTDAPTTAEELRRFYETPPLATNAAPLYTNAFSLLPDYGSSGNAFLWNDITNLPLRNAPMPKATRNELAKFCNENAALFDSLSIASQVKECRYTLHFSNDVMSTPVLYLSDINRCAKSMRAHCYWLIETGQIDRAVNSLCDQVALAQSLDRDPFLLSQYSRSACLTQCELGLERLLSRKKLDALQLTRLEQAFQWLSFKEGFARGLASERCIAIVLCQLPTKELRDMDILGLLSRIHESSTNSSRWAQLDMQSYRESATFVQDILFAVQSCEILIKAVDTPFPEAWELAKAFASNVAIAQTNLYVFTSLLTPSLRKTFERYAESEARLRVTRGALAIERMRLADNGRLPENADDPAVRSAMAGLNDPFDGKPIRYKRRAVNSYIVYSIGPNEKDDGGIPREESKDKTAYDLVFIVTR